MLKFRAFYFFCCFRFETTAATLKASQGAAKEVNFPLVLVLKRVVPLEVHPVQVLQRGLVWKELLPEQVERAVDQRADQHAALQEFVALERGVGARGGAEQRLERAGHGAACTASEGGGTGTSGRRRPGADHTTPTSQATKPAVAPSDEKRCCNLLSALEMVPVNMTFTALRRKLSRLRRNSDRWSSSSTF
jgi:hypothetical protein